MKDQSMTKQELLEENAFLKQKIRELEQSESERKRAEERLTKINACLLSLGPDFDENVARLTALCGELLGATCALYNRLESGMLYSIGQWHTPSDYAAGDRPDGHICYDVIRQGSDEVLVVRNLSQTSYAATDPNVTKYGLRTYFGQAVRCAGEPVGSLCVVFQRDVEPTDDDKRILGIIASSLTSEEGRKRVEESLRKSEEKYRLIADNMADVIVVTDMNLRYTYVSPSVMRLSGFTVEEVMEQIPEQTMTIESSRIIYKTYEEEMKLEAGGKANPKRTRIMELEIYRKDGSTFSAELSLSFLRDTDQKPIGILSVTRDITERKRTEDALRESEKKYRLVLEANPDPMIVYDVEGKVIYLNPAFTGVFGWSLKERIGKKLDDFVPEESWPETRMMIDMVIAGKSFFGIETRRLTREGKIIPVSISGACYRNQEGNIEASVINLRDITESKRVEAEKKKLEEQYKQAQKMEAIGQLAGGIAHDFNNMLNIILGYSQMALMKLEPSSQLYISIREVVNAARRSADLVRQLLAFARKQTIAPKVLNLNDTVAGMLNMLRRLIGEDIDLLWMPAANLWPVKMDPAQVDQLLANLAVNARDSISGVGKIAIGTGNEEFDDSYCAHHAGFVPGYYAMLAVSDNGCGMDRDTCEKIFEPFFTTKEVGKGTGMGLATVYGIVKQNNGFINVYSEPGKGTTFKIYLPRIKEDGPESDEPGAYAKPLTGAETVLLVEDNEALLKMSKMMLEELGYTVLAAISPNEAIKLAGQYAGDIHLAVTDVVMPEMIIRDLQKRLSALWPDMKYLFMSGYTADAIAHRGILDEGVHFLQKPFHLEELATKVREALERP